MEARPELRQYADRTWVLKGLGALLLLGGLGSGLLGPLEMYCFYLFSRGGRFYYEGFGFGSFMFANIASQIIGYYLIAALCILLGYGHLTLRRWTRPLAVTWLWTWLVIGAPVSGMVFFVLAASKDISLPGALLALAGLGLGYLGLPGGLIRFYQGRNVRGTLEAKDPQPGWLERVPIPALVLSSLYGFCVVVFHILILFNGIFPAMGVFVYGLPGIVGITVCIAALLVLVWGTLNVRRWAWWGGVLGLGLLTFSTLFTFVRTSYADLLTGLALPPREIDMLAGIPAQGYHFAILAGLPLLITWVIALLSKRHFGR